MDDMGTPGIFPLAKIAGCNYSIFVMHCIINQCPKSARSGTTTLPLNMMTSTKGSPLCLKCVTVKRSGESSCCARGGAWFKTCGDTSDAKFNHTWAEGIQACKSALCGETELCVELCQAYFQWSDMSCCRHSGHVWPVTTWCTIDTSCLFGFLNVRISTEPTTPSVSSMRSSNGCPKCATIKKSGKLSCCARGGAWFQKCGDAGDSNFDHTWVEGIQACKSTLLRDWFRGIHCDAYRVIETTVPLWQSCIAYMVF